MTQPLTKMKYLLSKTVNKLKLLKNNIAIIVLIFKWSSNRKL